MQPVALKRLVSKKLKRLVSKKHFSNPPHGATTLARALRDLAANLFAGKTSVNGPSVEFVQFFTKSSIWAQTADKQRFNLEANTSQKCPLDLPSSFGSANRQNEHKKQSYAS